MNLFDDEIKETRELDLEFVPIFKYHNKDYHLIEIKNFSFEGADEQSTDYILTHPEECKNNFCALDDALYTDGLDTTTYNLTDDKLIPDGNYKIKLVDHYDSYYSETECYPEITERL